MFDIATLETRTRSEAGATMQLNHPSSGSPILDDKGQPITITLLGRNSDAYERAARVVVERRIERNARGVVATADEAREDECEILTACTKGWSFDKMGNEDFPCTPENIRKFWRDRRFPWIFEAAQRFVLSDGNFLGT
jgi:hypothetical protein